MSPDRIEAIHYQPAIDPMPSGKIVYLDTNHWVGIRDAIGPKGGSNEYLEVHQLVREMTVTGRISIPATLPLLVEVLKQSEPTKSLTLALMYDLCRCFMVSPSELDILEFNGYPDGQCPTAWTLPIDMFEQKVVSLLPKLKDHNDDAEKAQRFVDDFRKRFSLKDFVETCLSHSAVDSEEQKAYIEGQNVQIEQNRETYPFPKLFNDCWRAKAEQIVRRWKKAGKLSDDLSFQLFRNFWWPGCVIPAWLLAYVGCDKSNYRMQKGDDADFIHSRLALPYCDYFFTDRRLKNLCSQKPPSAPCALKDLNSMCRATVIDDRKEILTALRSLA